MKRLTHYAAALAVLGLAGLARGDDVTYLEKGVKAEAKGKIKKEDAGGIRIEERGGVKDIPALNVVGVLYDQTVVKDALAYRRPFSAVESAALANKYNAKLAEAQKELQALAPRFEDVPALRRHIAYCLCQIAALYARDDPKDDKRRDAAIDALKAFAGKYLADGGWQIVPALNALARLQEEKKKPDEALKTYQQLASLKDVPRELKFTSELLVGQLLMRERRFGDAEQKWASLVKDLPPNDAQRPAFVVMLVQTRLEQNKTDGAEDELRKALNGTEDPHVKAMAHNALGDYYLQKKDPESAFWNYLRVDVLYPQDLAEHARALYHLGTLFDAVKNSPVRAQQCRDKLKEDQYKGTEYRLKADQEK